MRVRVETQNPGTLRVVFLVWRGESLIDSFGANEARDLQLGIKDGLQEHSRALHSRPQRSIRR